MCSFQNLEKIENRIPKFNRSINFLGKSDYHPIILIIIDHHFDTKETFENHISCGSWLLEAIKLKNIVLELPLLDKGNFFFFLS